MYFFPYAWILNVSNHKSISPQSWTCGTQKRVQRIFSNNSLLIYAVDVSNSFRMTPFTEL